MPCSSGSGSCATCLDQGSACGWCQSTLNCQEGDRLGPATPDDCDPWAWYYAYCAGDAADKCPKLTTCSTCLTDGVAVPFRDPTSCGWCTSASGDQRCANGQISGPAIGARCVTGGWLFAQLDVPSMRPAAPASTTRTASATPSTGAPASTSPTASSAGAGGAASPLTAELLGLSITFGLLLACVCGVALGWYARRVLARRASKPATTPRRGSVAFAESDISSKNPTFIVKEHPMDRSGGHYNLGGSS